MTDDRWKKQLTRHAREVTDPLFIQDYFLADGHDVSTPNGTATFVKFEGRIYVCTCFHVVATTETSRRMTTALMMDRGKINLSAFTVDGLRSSFHSPDESAEGGIDLAIACADSIWQTFSQRKGKAAIDLDSWTEPNWSEIEMCAAVGYLDEHKSISDNQVATPMAEVFIETASPLGSAYPTFTLFSSCAEPSGYYLSGISGGPVFGLVDSTARAPTVAIGLVFEGWPGSRKAVQSDGSFYGPNDILVRAHTLTPDRFANWLGRTPLG